MLYLRQATSITIMLGPFVSSDGIALTTLTISPGDIRLSKEGGGFAGPNLTASNAVHDESGYYSTIFNNTDTGSLGRLLMASSIALSLPVWHEFMVLPTSIYDAQIFGSVPFNINVETWRGSQPNALVSGRTDASAGAIADSVVTSAAIAESGVQKMSNLLATDMSSITATIAARSPINALRAMRNRVDSSSGSLIVYEEDDSTAAWSAAITQNASANPIVEIDPI